MTPIIKWIGSKRRLLPELKKYIPKNFNTYYEPFLGSGAMLFDLQPKNAIINDANGQLMNMYWSIKGEPEAVINYIKYDIEHSSKEFYYDLRSVDRDKERFNQMSNAELAARFWYINHFGYNGLWRVNKKNQCNVAYNSHNKVHWTHDIKDNILNMSQYLRQNNIQLFNRDFYDLLNNVKKDDFIYLDPPYAIDSNKTSATQHSYYEGKFDNNVQIQLMELASSLAKRGAYVMLSNADIDFINNLYSDSIFNIHHTLLKKIPGRTSTSRKNSGKVIITTY